MKYQEILNKGSQILKANNIESSNLDCELILSKVLKKTREEILINLTNKIDNKQKNEFVFYLNKRKKKNPISHILGFKFFWKYKFYINKSTLIPRPESEHLVEQTLKYMQMGKSMKILDIGTGSGCLVISILNERGNCTASAIDISKEALEVAEKNLKIHSCYNQIQLKMIDYKNINSKFDLIVSNPPYLTNEQFNNADPEVRNFEPKLALVGGDDGLKFYREYSKNIKNLMNKSAYFICEIGINQRQDCEEIFENSGLNLNKIVNDLQGIERILSFSKI